MTPEKLKLARNYMGYSVNEMADALRLSPATAAQLFARWKLVR
jgi:transcriptional regulator with XRE-family HTH domain